MGLKVSYIVLVHCVFSIGSIDVKVLIWVLNSGQYLKTTKCKNNKWGIPRLPLADLYLKINNVYLLKLQ
jgi:hypothetical protein